MLDDVSGNESQNTDEREQKSHRIKDYLHLRSILATAGVELQYDKRFDRVEIRTREHCKLKLQDWTELDDTLLLKLSVYLCESAYKRFKDIGKHRLKEWTDKIAISNEVDSVISKFAEYHRLIDKFGDGKNDGEFIPRVIPTKSCQGDSKEELQNEFYKVFNKFGSTYFEFATDNDELIANWAFKYLFVALAFLSVKPGDEQVDKVLVWIGEQAFGKSRFCRTLGGLLNRSAYSDQGHLGGKSDKQTLEEFKGVGVVEVPDGVGVLTCDQRRQKAAISRRKVVARKAYAHSVSYMLCQYVIIVTENNAECLQQDITGQRRFAPFHTTGYSKSIDGQTDKERSRNAQRMIEGVLPFMLGIAWRIVWNGVDEGHYLTVREYLDMPEELKQAHKEVIASAEVTDEAIEYAAAEFKKYWSGEDVARLSNQKNLTGTIHFYFPLTTFQECYHLLIDINLSTSHSFEGTKRFVEALKKLGATQFRLNNCRFWYFPDLLQVEHLEQFKINKTLADSLKQNETRNKLSEKVINYLKQKGVDVYES